MTHSTGSEQIQAFAQHVLGCGCPEEVFQTIETGWCISDQDQSIRFKRILIGNRLLIYLVPFSVSAPGEQILTELVQKGRAERDHNGYNRLRVVLVHEDNAESPDLQQIFAQETGNDDRAFLHVLPQKMVQEVLSE